MDNLNIPYRATRNLKTSVWGFDGPWLKAGETATVYGWHVADATNPLYKVRRDRDGDPKAVYREDLLANGEFV